MKTTLTISLGVFRSGDSILHRLHPLVKLFGLSLLLAGVVFADTPVSISLLLLAALILALSAGMSYLEIVREVRAFWFFYIITLLLHFLIDKGERVLFSLYAMNFTLEGLQAGIIFSVKIAAVALVGASVIRTTHPADWAKVFDRFGSSRNVISRSFHRFGLILGLSLRMLPTILQEAERIRTAQIARGLEPAKGGPVQRTKSLLALIIPLLSNTLDRADSITSAMQSRGYSLEGVRTGYREIKMTALDWGTLVSVLGTAGLIVAL
jgi:energy-coupling factor transport system permease protein